MIENLMSYRDARLDPVSVGPTACNAELDQIETWLFENGHRKRLYQKQSVEWLNLDRAGELFQSRLCFEDGRRFQGFVDTLKPFRSGIKKIEADRTRKKFSGGKTASYRNPIHALLEPDQNAKQAKHLEDKAFRDYKITWNTCLKQSRILRSVGDQLNAALVWPSETIRPDLRRTTRFLFVSKIDFLLSCDSSQDALPKSKRGYAAADEEVVSAALALLRSGEADNPNKATDAAIAKFPELVGGGEPGSKRDRIYRRVLKRWKEEHERS